MAFVNEKTATVQRTIDYERNAILIDTGTNRESYTTFELTWKDSLIKIIAHRNFWDDENKQTTVCWRIHGLYIFPELEAYRVDIVKMVVEAINAYGLFYSHDRIKAIDITFSENIKLS